MTKLSPSFKLVSTRELGDGIFAALVENEGLVGSIKACFPSTPSGIARTIARAVYENSSNPVMLGSEPAIFTGKIGKNNEADLRDTYLDGGAVSRLVARSNLSEALRRAVVKAVENAPDRSGKRDLIGLAYNP